MWHMPRNEKVLYLTFDDGPIPEITPWVLEQLNAYNAKATFFSIGDNINKHPDIFKQILNQEHAIGNHTCHHINGWNTSVEDYVLDTQACQNNIEKQTQSLEQKNDIEKNSSHVTHHSSLLFRPPYGKITSKQSKKLQELGYEIVMWDVLSADFDQSISKEKCLSNVLKTIKNGSIVVFHDSLKAELNLRYVLPKVLDDLSKKGFQFKAL